MRTSTLGILAVSVLAGLAGELVFGPEPRTEVERRWTETMHLEIDALEETLGGNPLNLSFNRIEFEQKRSFEVNDVLTKSDGGRPVDLQRKFAGSSLAFALSLDDARIGRVEGRHACEHSVVRFVFDPEAEEYARELVEGEVDEERLEELEPDLDLLALLPPGAVEVGAEWELEPAALRGFFRAGGGLDFEAAEVMHDLDGVPAEILLAGALGSLHELFDPAGDLSGKVQASYASQDGGLARLEYELDLELGADLGERLRSMVGADADQSTLQFRVEAELEGKLVLLWDVSGRHLYSARFQGDASMKGHLAFQLSLVKNHPPQEFIGDYEVSGEAEVELTVE